jgi:hypothetical protein
MKHCIWLVLLTAASGFAQSYKTCDVTMWTNESHLQAGVAHDSVLYFIRVGQASYQIERPGSNVEMNAGERINCRVDKGYMFIRDSKGQVNKAQIVESGRLQDQH